MDPYSLEKTIATDISKVLPLAHGVSRSVYRLTHSDELAFKIKLAIEEALTNAMRHGNKLDRRLKVCIKITADAKKITIDIRDQGGGFDHRRVPDPTTPQRASHPSGRGVFLMRKIMDSVRYYDQGRRIVLVKSLRKHAKKT